MDNREEGAAAVAAIALEKGLDYLYRMMSTIVAQPTDGRPTADEMVRTYAKLKQVPGVPRIVYEDTQTGEFVLPSGRILVDKPLPKPKGRPAAKAKT